MTLHGTTKAPSLDELARALGGVVRGDGAIRPTGLFQDSRKVEPGALFVVRRGKKTEGSAYVADARARGAVALLAEPGQPAVVESGLPVVEVADARASLGRAAALVYDEPTRKLDVVGITGTNGKTTTAWLTGSCIAAAGGRPGIVGTVSYRFEDWVLGAPNTTPEVDDLTRFAADIVVRGATHLVMEASSHALALGRVDGLPFRVAAFTNLTQDHLDFHGDMESYGKAKARLFTDLAPRAAVLDIDDPFGAKLARTLSVPLLRVSAVPGTAADVVPLAVQLSSEGICARLATPRGTVELRSSLIGAHNLSNLVVSVGILSALGLDLERALTGLDARDSVPGRLERCDGPGDDVRVLVDYAHTPDALERALAVVRASADERRARVVCVFGCGGDRDRTKRAPMGAAVARSADVAIVTSDNPRSERPGDIIAQILPGLSGAPCEVVVEEDRASAIARAVAAASPGDVVLIAGKGHETYQIVGSVTRHFDDREEARAALARRRSAGEKK